MSSQGSSSRAAVGHLTGTVEYRLDLDGGDSPSTSTKRPRPIKEDATTGKQNTSWVGNAGYFFVPDAACHTRSDAQSRRSRSRGHRGYPIIYPFSCIDTICKAATTGSRVKVTRYEWTNFGHSSLDEDDSSSSDDDDDDDDDSEGRLHSQGTTESSSSFASTGTSGGDGGPIEYSAKVLEVRRGGVAIVELEGSKGANRSPSKDDEPQPMTLSEFAELEEKMRSTSKSSGGSGKRGLSSSERFSVTAKIDATSAIIATLRSDPFALVELYEESSPQRNEAPLSAVVVLRGRSALAAHAALHPGATVTFTNVLRQRWHIPKSFQQEGKLDVATAARLKHRAPSHVFVVNHGRSISWSLDCKQKNESSIIDSPKEIGPSKILFPTLPSTPVPLVAIQGLVTSLRRASLGAAGEIIHSIIIETLDGQKSKLYLTYYPLTPELIWGLRRGSYIRAINVQPVNGGTWDDCDDNDCCVLGALVRSTVVILDHARTNRQDNRHSNASSSLLLTQAPEMPQLPATKCKPYSFMNMKLTYDEMEWREQLRSVWYDESGLESVTDDSFDTLFRNLLAQHEKTSEVQKCNANDNPKSKRKRKGKRDAYVEFFYFPSDDDSLQDKPPVWPVVMPLERIRNGCVREFRKLLKEFSSKSCPDRLRMKSGWTASKSFGRESLSKILVGRHDENIPFYACGVAGPKLLSLRDGSCQLPVCLGLCDDDALGANLESHLLASVGMRVQDGSIVALPISSVEISCMCLGPKPKASCPDDEAIDYLPVSSVIDGVLMGSCAIFVVKDFLFIASAHVKWNGAQSIRSSSSVRSKKRLITIQESLSEYSGSAAANSVIGASNTFVAGRLVRSRFGLRKIQHDAYKGCVLTLSHSPVHRDDSQGEKVGRDAQAVTCDVQTIELKLIANNILGRATRQMRQTLRQLLQRVEEVDPRNHTTALVSYSVCDDQIGLATAWWCIADDARHTPLLCGGRDEFLSMTWAHRSSDVYIRFPLAARETSEQGYCRFKCALDDVVSFAISSSKGGEDTTVRSDVFDRIGGEKFLPGMIDRVPERFKGAGERLQPCPPESLSGIPTQNLAQLHMNMCRDISQKTRTTIAPSLAIRVTDARLLGISFCRARAECTHCYQFLIRRGKKDDKQTQAKSGVITSVRLTTPSSISTPANRVACSADEKSFWHLPLGEEVDAPRPDFTKDLPSPSKSAPQENISGSPARSSRKSSAPTVVRTNLRCPNECPIECSAIKWEVSGIIDDGTGQAKLHAEREAALALLGVDLDVKSVEDGAWAIEGGITYQKSVPPRSFIRNAVREAQMAAQAFAREAPRPKKKRKIAPKDVLSLLTPEAKGEYTLQRYCRFSKISMRPMDVVCRCKPISDKAGDRELNRTDVEVTTARCEDGQAAVTTDTITYTLPPLKLNLVDLFAVPTTPREDGWSLVQSLDG